jgi:hypothetical protein
MVTKDGALLCWRDSLDCSRQRRQRNWHHIYWQEMRLECASTCLGVAGVQGTLVIVEAVSWADTHFHASATRNSRTRSVHAERCCYRRLWYSGKRGIDVPHVASLRRVVMFSVDSAPGACLNFLKSQFTNAQFKVTRLGGGVMAGRAIKGKSKPILSPGHFLHTTKSSTPSLTSLLHHHHHYLAPSVTFSSSPSPRSNRHWPLSHLGRRSPRTRLPRHVEHDAV